MAANPQTGFEINRPTVVAAIYLVGALTGGLIGIVGLVLAYVWKSDAHEPWEASHYSYLIRTFWIGLAASVICFVGLLVGFGSFGAMVLLMFVSVIWVAVRSIMSLLNAQKPMPMPDPTTFLI